MKKHLFCFMLFILLSPAASGRAENPPDLSGLNAVSYSAGFRLGDMFVKQRIPLIPEMVMRGLEDARKTDIPLLPKGEMRTILSDPRKYLIESAAQREDLAKKAGQSFLAANAREHGVTVLPSGLQYRIIAAGNGVQPQSTDSVQLNYEAATVNGQVFDSTYSKGTPATLAINQLIPGLAEGLQLMAEGSTWELYIPPRLGYGKRGPLADQTLVYTVELLKVMPPQ